MYIEKLIVLSLVLIMFSCDKKQDFIQLVKKSKQNVLASESVNDRIQPSIIEYLSNFLENSDAIKVKSLGDKKIELSYSTNSIVYDDNKIVSIKTVENSVENTLSIADLSSIIVKKKYKNKLYKSIFSKNDIEGNMINLNADNVLSVFQIVNNDTLSYKQYFEDNKVKMLVSFKNGKRDGQYVEKYHNNIVKIKTTYKEGLLEGEYKEWYDNAKLSFKTNYSKGKKSGEAIAYYKDVSSMKNKVSYVNGIKNGVENGWNKEAKKLYMIPFENGYVNGTIVLYHETKNLMKLKANYKEGERHGDFTVWNIEGHRIYNASYENDTLVKVSKENVEGSKEIDKFERDYF